MTDARLATCSLGHAAVMAELHGACFAVPWQEEDFAKLLAAPGAWALMVMADAAGDEPCGFILWRVAADEAEIITLCVLRPQRGNNMGRALTKGAMERAGAAAKPCIWRWPKTTGTRAASMKGWDLQKPAAAVITIKPAQVGRMRLFMAEATVPASFHKTNSNNGFRGMFGLSSSAI